MSDNFRSTVNTRKEFEVLRAELENERSTFLPTWKDAADFVVPRRPRFCVTDTNKGDRRTQNIIDSSATLALRTLKSGMMSGITSPARQWFRLTTPDPDMAEFGPVKEWLYQVTQRLSHIFLKSNLYKVLPLTYGDTGTFATGGQFVTEDFEDTIRSFSMPIGSYSISNNQKGNVDTFTRDFTMTVRQIVERFGQIDPESGRIDWANISQTVKELWFGGNYETRFDIAHVVKPNPLWDPRKAMPEYKRYISAYYERGTGGSTSGTANYMNGNSAEQNKFLEFKGYDLFPGFFPRWEVNGEDSWGTDCPAITALGDIRQLQTGERRGSQAIEKMVTPPMTGPSSLRKTRISHLPGDVTYSDSRTAGDGFRPAYQVNFPIDMLEMKQDKIRARISRSFYEDLFLMIANSGGDMTAREVAAKEEEKLLAIGPVLEQMNSDLLDPLIDTGFAFGARQNMFPPPPPEIQGMRLKIDYISVMAQAQKMIGIGAMERFMTVATSLAKVDPSVLDKVNLDQFIDVYSDDTSVPPGIVRSDEEVAEIRNKRAAQQRAQAQAQQINEVAQAGKTMSETNMEGDTALSRVMGAASA